MEDSILYLFGFSPFQGTQLKNLIEIIKLQVLSDIKISLVLLHDGVIGASQKGRTPEFLKHLLKLPIQFKALLPDLKARGINASELLQEIEGIEYKDLVDLLVANQKIVSWM
ncbi:MAG: sulfurtransferase complex subunit TusB [Promethearchaeota archaeon]